jgi:hypothetical protein
LPCLLDREQASYVSSARAGRSRERQAKWAGPRVGAPGAALATARRSLYWRLRRVIGKKDKNPAMV